MKILKKQKHFALTLVKLQKTIIILEKCIKTAFKKKKIGREKEVKTNGLENIYTHMYI